MERLSYAEWIARGDEVAASIRESPGIAAFCSSPAWQVSANEFLHFDSLAKDYFIVRDENAWVIFAERTNPRVYFPLESAWMFGCPLLGPPGAAIDLLEKASRTFLEPPYGFCIGGVPLDGPLHSQLLEKRATAQKLEVFSTTDCMILDLSSGSSDWLARRSNTI